MWERRGQRVHHEAVALADERAAGSCVAPRAISEDPPIVELQVEVWRGIELADLEGRLARVTPAGVLLRAGLRIALHVVVTDPAGAVVLGVVGPIVHPFAVPVPPVIRGFSAGREWRQL